MRRTAIETPIPTTRVLLRNWLRSRLRRALLWLLPIASEAPIVILRCHIRSRSRLRRTAIETPIPTTRILLRNWLRSRLRHCLRWLLPILPKAPIVVLRSHIRSRQALRRGLLAIASKTLISRGLIRGRRGRATARIPPKTLVRRNGRAHRRLTHIILLSPQLINLLGCQRPTLIRAQGLLPRFKRNRSCGRRRTRNHFTVEHRIAWTRHRPALLPSKQALPLRSHTGRKSRNLSRPELVRRPAERATLHWPRTHKILPRNRRKSAWSVPVDVNIRHIAIDRDVVIFPPIQLTLITLRNMISRPIFFPRTQREPTHSAPAANSDRKPKASSTHKGHQRRSIYRPRYHRPRIPSPSAARIGPATVMERRKSPGRVIDPRPAPRVAPSPMAIMIRGPIRPHARAPYWAILIARVPTPIPVQIFVSHHLPGHISRRGRGIFQPVAVEREIVEIVRRVRSLDALLPAIAAKIGGLPGVHRKALTISGHFRFPAAHRHHGGIPVRVGVDPVIAGPQQRNRAVRSIHFPHVLIAQTAHAHNQRALRQPNLYRLIVQIEEAKICLPRQPDGVRTHTQLRTRALIGIQMIAGGQRIVQSRPTPFVHTLWLKRHRPFEQAQASHARRRILRRRAQGKRK